MDSKRLDELLQKYWNAETSLEEEQQLRVFFASESVPESLKETSTLFQYFDEQKKLGVGDNSFDKELLEKIRPKGKIISMVQVARIAAGLFVVVAAAYFIREEVRKAYPTEQVSNEEITNEDTYTDPKVAFEETKKALMMISKSFNKAQKQASKINVFNEATKKIKEHKEEPTEKKTNI